MRIAGIVALGSVLVITLALGAGPGAVSEKAVNEGDHSEWRLLGRTAEMQHHSPLAQINDKNVGQLGLAWYADVPTQDGLAGNPLVADGVVYQSGALGKVWAHDVRTGKLLWEFDAQIGFGQTGTWVSFWGSRVNRGVALLDDKVFVATGDCRLVAIDRRSGHRVWETQACDPSDNYTITGAPRVGGGKVFIGNACADTGLNRGYVGAYDAVTGKPIWRFYTVPGDPTKGFENEAMEMAAKTWGKEYWKKPWGCGSAWDAITYDPVLNQVYVGTDGPAPWNPQDRAEGHGDELFTNSIIALDADTGRYVWHYQTTPNDAWNFAATMHIMVADLPIGGQQQRVVMEAPKNGFFYVLDAKTGKLISANNIVPVNWATRIDPQTGRPVERPEARYYTATGKRAVVKPNPVGAHNWHAMSYDPATGLVYLPASDLPTPMEITNLVGGALGGNVHVDYSAATRDPKMKGKVGRLIAWDPLTQKARWSVNLDLPTNGGVLSTAGNLVFEGTATGDFRAYRADTGEPLWSFATGSGIQAAPTTVEIDGEQIILVPIGAGGALVHLLPSYTISPQSLGPARLLAFKLGGKTDLPKVQYVSTFPKPPRPPYPAEQAKLGALLWENKGCDLCHGENAIHLLGSILDVRKASAATLEVLGSIVIGGSRRDKGMPAFGDSVSGEELNTIQAFIINQAWAAYNEQESATERKARERAEKAR